MITRLVNIPPQNLQLQHKMHHKLGTNNHFVRVPTRVVSPRPNTYSRQSYSGTSPRRIITFNSPTNSDDEIQDETQKITSFRNTSVDVSSPTRTILDITQNTNTTQNITRSMYDPPSFPSTFKYPNKTIRSEDNNNQQTFSRYYDPFNYSFYPQYNRNIQTNNKPRVLRVHAAPLHCDYPLFFDNPGGAPTDSSTPLFPGVLLLLAAYGLQWILPLSWVPGRRSRRFLLLVLIPVREVLIAYILSHESHECKMVKNQSIIILNKLSFVYFTRLQTLLAIRAKMLYPNFSTR